MYEVMQTGWRRFVGPDRGPLGVAALSVCAGVSGGLGGMVGNPIEVREPEFVEIRKLRGG